MKSAPKNTPPTSRQREQPLGQRRRARRFRLGKVCRPAGHHRVSRKKLQGRRVRGLLGLDEHRRLHRGRLTKARSTAWAVPIDDSTPRQRTSAVPDRSDPPTSRPQQPADLLRLAQHRVGDRMGALGAVAQHLVDIAGIGQSARRISPPIRPSTSTDSSDSASLNSREIAAGEMGERFIPRHAGERCVDADQIVGLGPALEIGDRRRQRLGVGLGAADLERDRTRRRRSC